MPCIDLLQDRHPDSTIYVIGAGGTLNFLDPAFFRGQLVIAINEVASHWPIAPQYIVTKYHEIADEKAASFPDVAIIVPRFQYGNRSQPERAFDQPNVYRFDHVTNHGQDFDASRHWPEGPGDLVVSWSTITTGIHLGAYLGASTLILVGHDCGQLGDKNYVDSYRPGLTDENWFTTIENQSIGVKKELVRRYGTRVYSLSPFINYNLEGTPYVGRNLINVSAQNPRRDSPMVAASAETRLETGVGLPPKRVVLTGAAGFIGSHCRAPVREGHDVIGVDNFITGRRENLAVGAPARFPVRRGRRQRGRSDRRWDDFDWVLHFASPASPPKYLGASHRDAAGQRRRHVAPAQLAERAGRAVPAGQHQRGLRRPARPPAAGVVLGQRQPDRPAQRVRRGEALRRGDHDRHTAAAARLPRASSASSTPTAPAWTRTTAASSPISSARRCSASR